MNNYSGGYNYGVRSKSTYSIIQGDTFQKTLYIRSTGGDKIPDECITRMFFTCAKLGIDKKEIPLKKDSKGQDIKGMYNLSFTSDETARFPKGSTTYDITIEFGKVGSPVIKTVRYEYPLDILPKTNRVDYSTNF